MRWLSAEEEPTSTRRRDVPRAYVTGARSAPRVAAQASELDGAVNVREHGAAGDGIADDTAAIQAAITAATGSQASLRGGSVVFPKGTYRITDTVDIIQASAAIQGAGWSTATASREALGSVIVWDGPPGIPMFRLDYCWGTRLSGFRFVARRTSKPGAAISLRNLTSHPSGSNFNVLSNIWIGTMAGFEPQTGQSFDNGILVEGDNVNGDTNRFRDIVIFDSDVGVRITQQQFIRNHFSMLRISGCDTAFSSNATISTSGDNWVLSRSAATDIELGVAARLRVDGFSSEAARRMVVGQSSCLMVRDGYWQIGPTMASDGLVIDGRGGSGRSFLRLEDFDFTEGAAAPARVHWEPPSQVFLANVSGLREGP